MPGIGRDGEDLVLVAVERIGIEPQFLVPENLVKPRKQSSSLCTQVSRTLGLAKNIEDFRHADPSIVDVSLKLAERLGPRDRRAIGIHDRIAGILPGHVLVACRGARLVFLKSIAVAVPVLVDPYEAAFRSVQVLFQQLSVPGRAPGGVQGYQIKRCRVGGAVVWCVRDELEMRKLAVAQLVEDLSRLSLAVWIVFLGLQPA